MNSVFAFLYLYLIVPVLSLLVFLFAPFVGKIREGLKHRNYGLPRKYSKLNSDKDIYWFHCSSGELEYAAPLIRELKAQKNCQIVLTWHSPSVLKLIRDHHQIDYIVASPWESRSSYKKFLKHFSPKKLFISRTDVWPAQLLACKQAGIESVLFSATFVQNSARNKNRFLRTFYSWVHNLISEIYCVTEEDKKMYESLDYLGKIFVTGDTRYEQVIWKLEEAGNFKTNIKSDQRLLLVAGSTWPEDEKVLLDAYLQNKDELRLIIAPHEPSDEHLMPLVAFCENNQLSYKLFSQTHEFEEDILIIDKVGVLASAYSKSDLAFIGGAFKGSIHSVMEGLAAGLICLFGPQHKNNREAIEFQSYNLGEHLSMAISVSDRTSLSAKLQSVIKNKSSLATYKEKILEKIREKAGTSKIILSKLY